MLERENGGGGVLISIGRHNLWRNPSQIKTECNLFVNCTSKKASLAEVGLSLKLDLIGAPLLERLPASVPLYLSFSIREVKKGPEQVSDQHSLPPSNSLE